MAETGPRARREHGEQPRPRPSVGTAYSRSLGEAGPYLFIGIQVAGAMLLFVAAGYLADQWLGTSPWLLILGAILGMVAVIATVVRAVQQLDAHNRRERHREESR